MDVTQEERMKAYLMGWAYRKGENMRKGLPDDGVTYQQMELAYYMGLAQDNQSYSCIACSNPHRVWVSNGIWHQHTYCG